MSGNDSQCDKVSVEPESPTTPTKRKRVQHDYRRLSSAGYVDDYERGRERFSSDKEENSSPSPTLKLKNQKPNKVQSDSKDALPIIKSKEQSIPGKYIDYRVIPYVHLYYL